MIPAERPAGLPDPAAIAALVETSYLRIIELQDPSGAYPASPTFSAYRGYAWFRDGAFIADGVSSYGGEASASAFHDWCARAVEARGDRIAEIVAAASAGAPVPGERMLATRFTLDGADGDDEWWDFQLDGYGTWLWAVVAHARRHGLALDRWAGAMRRTADYLLSSWQRPCFDWWEEHQEQVHGSTLGCIAAGLRAAAEAGVLEPAAATRARVAIAEIEARLADEGTAPDGALRKWLGSDAVDASAAALIAPLGLIPADSTLAAATIQRIRAELDVDGGVHRFAADVFYGGGQWPLLSCFLGLAEAASGDREAALAHLRWAAATAASNGDLPEQVPWHLLAPEHRQEWLDRWGTVALPLLWSHAMLIRLAVELGVADPAGSAAIAAAPIAGGQA